MLLLAMSFLKPKLRVWTCCQIKHVAITADMLDYPECWLPQLLCQRHKLILMQLDNTNLLAIVLFRLRRGAEPPRRKYSCVTNRCQRKKDHYSAKSR